MSSDKRQMTDFEDFGGEIVNGEYHFPTLYNCENKRMWRIRIRLIPIKEARRTGINWNVDDRKYIDILPEHLGDVDIPPNTIAQVWTESGLKTGKITVSEPTYPKPANIGRANYRNSLKQAMIHARGHYLKHIEKGERTDCGESEKKTNRYFPMLAHNYDDYPPIYPVAVQPKLDGMRCLATIKDGVVTLKSRDGKIIENMDHITQDLSKIKINITLDGELYAHGLSFQENMKLIKKYRQGKTENIKYIVYDKVSDDNYSNRYRDIVDYRILNELTSKNWMPIEGCIIKSEEELLDYHKQFISKGYEGSMIKHSDKPYGINKRCDSLLKYKDFQDIDAKILDIVPAEQRPEQGVPVLEYNSQTFKAGCKMTHEEREELLTNKDEYIGKLANIRFFEMTDGGIPRFPIMVGIHQDR